MIDPGARLREARTRLNLTQTHAAELLATSQANVSAYERGRLDPGRLVAERITAFANLQADSVYATYSASTLLQVTSATWKAAPIRNLGQLPPQRGDQRLQHRRILDRARYRLIPAGGNAAHGAPQDLPRTCLG